MEISNHFMCAPIWITAAWRSPQKTHKRTEHVNNAKTAHVIRGICHNLLIFIYTKSNLHNTAREFSLCNSEWFLYNYHCPMANAVVIGLIIILSVFKPVACSQLPECGRHSVIMHLWPNSCRISTLRQLYQSAGAGTRGLNMYNKWLCGRNR